MDRIAAARDLLETYRADAVLISCLPHVRWMSGFTGSAAIVLVDGDHARLITDGRYREQAAREVEPLEVCIADLSPLEHLIAAGWLSTAARVLIQGEHVSASDFRRLEDHLGDTKLVATDGLMDQMVARKETYEIHCIQKAQEISELVYRHLTHWLHAGLTEQEIAAEIVYHHLRRGAEKMSFDPIVASGPNSALPHARPGTRALEYGDVVLLDFGCVWRGYASDMTRTVAIGAWDDEATTVFQVVKEAQEKAICGARSGMMARELDSVARDHISSSGFGELFSHSLGHGVGMQVHEWPRVGARSEHVLPEGAVITVEPGIYVPGRFGVRIEDMVVLRPDGCANLTNVGKEQLVIRC